MSEPMTPQPLVRIILSTDPDDPGDRDAEGREYRAIQADISVGEHQPDIHPHDIADALMVLIRGLPARLAELWDVPLVARAPGGMPGIDADSPVFRAAVLSALAAIVTTETGMPPVGLIRAANEMRNDDERRPDPIPGTDTEGTPG